MYLSVFLAIRMQKDRIKNKNQIQLVEAIKNNNSSVLQALYISNYSKIEKFIVSNNGSKEQAKDIFQEAYIASWKNVKNDKFIPKNETAINGYLYTIAKNKWMDYLRSVQYKKNTFYKEGNFKVEEKSTYDSLDLDNELVYEKKMNLAMKAFKELKKPCKELLTKFYFEKKSMAEIAEELSIDAASTRNKKYRCMQKLRELALNSKSK